MSVFELVHSAPDLVVLKVNADDPLTVAMHPYVSAKMAYISLQFKPVSGHTLISESFTNLVMEVKRYVESRGIKTNRDFIFTITNKDGSTRSISW